MYNSEFSILNVKYILFMKISFEGKTYIIVRDKPQNVTNLLIRLKNILGNIIRKSFGIISFEYLFYIASRHVVNI